MLTIQSVPSESKQKVICFCCEKVHGTLPIKEKRGKGQKISPSRSGNNIEGPQAKTYCLIISEYSKGLGLQNSFAISV